MNFSGILKVPTRPKHWIFLGILFVLLWAPRIVLFSADAIDVCSGVSSAPVNHHNPALSPTAIKNDKQMEVGRCGVLRAVMNSQLSAPQIPVSDITQQSQTFISRMSAAPLVSSSKPIVLHSRPAATRKIFLDFDGYTVISSNDWYNYWPSNSIKGISLDGNYGSFSAIENAYIQEIWAGVAEDFAPFDIDVTTEDPGTAGLSRNSSSDVKFGTTAVISDDFTLSAYCECGGIAYVGIIDDINSDKTPNPYAPSFNFISFSAGNYLSASDAAGVISHETGHNVGLGHDGTSSQGYYPGHENGLWAPIMGTSYEQSISQWSKNEYADGAVTDYTDIPSYYFYYGCMDSECQDDVKVISNYNSIPLIADDFGNNFASAQNLTGTVINQSGNIGANSDVDMFKFVLTNKHKLTLTASPIAKTPNLDIKMKIYNSSQNLLTTVDEVASRGSDGFAQGLTAKVTSYSLNAGTYYFSVEGTGALNPLTTGYSNYGSMGRYTLSGNLELDVELPLNITLPTISPSLAGYVVGATVTANSTSSHWTAISANALSFQWQKLTSGVWTPISKATRNTYVISTTDTGLRLRIAVTAKNDKGSTTAYSLESGVVNAPPTVSTNALTISGAGKIGQPMTFRDASTWSAFPNVTPTYQWYRCSSATRASQTSSTAPLLGCVPIAGATSTPYIPLSIDRSRFLTVAATGSNAYGTLVLWAKSSNSAIR